MLLLLHFVWLNYLLASDIFAMVVIYGCFVQGKRTPGARLFAFTSS